MNKSTVVKGVLAVLGVAIPSFFTYLAARADSDEAKVRAQVAYETLAESVKDLQAVTKELLKENQNHALQLAKLEGRFEAERRFSATPSLSVPTPKLSGTRFTNEGDVKELGAKMKTLPDFSEAVQTYKAKK